MELRITRCKVALEEDEYCYHVVYPVPAPDSSPKWLLIDEDGEAVCDSESPALQTLSTAAEAAFCRGAGEPLEKWISILGPSAREWAEGLGWVARYGPGRGQIILPDTRVFFPGGLPAGLREQAGGDLRRALSLLADCVRKWDADPVSVFVSIPEDVEGVIITAEELAAS